LTAIQCALKIAKVTNEEISSRERLLSGRLWSLFRMLKMKIEFETEPKKADDDNEDVQDVPSWWHEYETQAEKTDQPESNHNRPVFRKWLVYCKHRSTCRAIELFLADAVDHPEDYPEFSDLFKLMIEPENVFLALDKPDVHDFLREDYAGQQNKAIKKDTNNWLTQFLKPELKSGILLISDAFPKVEDNNNLLFDGLPVIDYGIRFDEPTHDYFNLPVVHQVWSLVSDLESWHRVDRVRDHMNNYLTGNTAELIVESQDRKLKKNIELTTKDKRLVCYNDDFQASMPILERFHPKRAVKILSELVKKCCVTDPFTSVTVEYSVDINGKEIAHVSLPMDFPLNNIYCSQPQGGDECRERGLEEACAMVIIDFDKKYPHRFLSYFPEKDQTIDTENDTLTSTRNNVQTQQHDGDDENETPSTTEEYYRRKFPDCLQGGPIIAGRPLYLYQIRFERLNKYYDGKNDRLCTYGDDQPSDGWSETNKGRDSVPSLK